MNIRVYQVSILDGWIANVAIYQGRKYREKKTLKKKIMRLVFNKFPWVIYKIFKGKFPLRNWKQKSGLQVLKDFRNIVDSWSHRDIDENIRTMCKVKRELKILVLENANIKGAVKWEKSTKENKKKCPRKDKQER